jgi:hypothetical protein
VDHVLQSGTFGHAPSSRRLLKYLADRALEGGAEQLKEYTIGVEAFGKSVDYDPRQDSTVRIQIGRLRQRLADYYRAEGREDAMVVDLPKGRFSLTCEHRTAVVPLAVVPEPQVVESDPLPADPPAGDPMARKWRAATFILLGCWLLLIALGGYAWSRSRITASPEPSVQWTPELAELWGPLIGTPRPLLIAVGNPLFLQFENKALYRDLSIEKPEDLLKSPQLAAVRRALGGQESRPVHYYAAVGDVSAAFLVGQRLGPHQAAMSVVRSSELQWQQLADANVLFLGPPRFFGDKLKGLPVALEILEGTDGFEVPHPKAGEQSFYKFRDPPGYFNEDGEACVLVTRAPGPAGSTQVMTFASNSTFGRAGAVAALTEPGFAKMMVGKMRDSRGRLPAYFQVLLRVRYKGGVPTETTYLLHREIRRN